MNDTYSFRVAAASGRRPRTSLQALYGALPRFGGAALAGLLASACAGPQGPQGDTGPAGVGSTITVTGPAGPPGTSGSNGDAGAQGRNAYLTGPGIVFQVLDVSIDAGGAATVKFRISDSEGVPLDRDGLFTEGAVSTHFVLAWLDQTSDGQARQYTAYTTTTQTSATTKVTATQAAEDSGGEYTLVDPNDGVYTFTFGTTVKVADPAKTHTLGVWASRDVKGVHYVANVTHDFLPSGGTPTVKRDIVQTTACNGCHNPMSGHEGDRRDTRLCVLCHSPQTTDPNTGNTLDFVVMVHKIHRGKTLPSVVAGKPYQLVGDQGTVYDYSTVAFPQELQNCNKCHTGSQGQNWQNPTRAPCASCHDLVSFDPLPVPAGMTAHVGGPQADDSKCTVCHPPVGGLEGIATKHLTPTLDPASPKLTMAIGAVVNTAPGQTPEIVFSVAKNGSPVDLVANPLPYLAVTMAGPTTDYASYTQYTILGPGSVGKLAVDPAGYRFTFPAPIPTSATGTYAFALEGYVQTGGPTSTKFSALNPIALGAVTDPAPVPRRTVVNVNQCDNCHYQLNAHDGVRKEVQYCAFCHNANEVNDQDVARREGTTVTAQALHMPAMIHRIHTGFLLTQQPYILYGDPGPTQWAPDGTPIDFSTVRFPRDRKACWSCHAGQSYVLPLPATNLPTRSQQLTCTEDPAVDADNYCDTRVVSSTTYTPPATAACTGCHDAPYVLAHALSNTVAGVEACATCHGPGKAFDAQSAHLPAP